VCRLLVIDYLIPNIKRSGHWFLIGCSKDSNSRRSFVEINMLQV
jgi:hypothetical protein